MARVALNGRHGCSFVICLRTVGAVSLRERRMKFHAERPLASLLMMAWVGVSLGICSTVAIAQSEEPPKDTEKETDTSTGTEGETTTDESETSKKVGPNTTKPNVDAEITDEKPKTPHIGDDDRSETGTEGPGTPSSRTRRTPVLP